MKFCHLCQRTIVRGKKIYDNGIQFECGTEQDIIECKKVIAANRIKERELKLIEFKNKQLLLSQMDNVEQCPSCKTYLTDYGIQETSPSRWCCPYCPNTFSFYSYTELAKYLRTPVSASLTDTLSVLE